MKKIKVLYMSHSSYINGAEMCLLNLVKHIDRKRIEPVVVFPYDGPLKTEIEALGITTYLSPLERWIRYPFESAIIGTDMKSRVGLVGEILRKESIDVVHTNTSVVLEGAIAAKIANIPHVWHINETLEGHPELRPCMPLPLVYWSMSYLSTLIVTPADLLKKQFLPVIDPGKLFTIYNGVDDKDYRERNAASVRAELGLGEKDVVAVTVAAVTERKGYPNLLKAASLVRKKCAGIKFVWVGGASQKDQEVFNSMIKELDLKDAVISTGFRRDFTRFIMDADFLIHPSINEAFPMVILDAMGAGKPVIATDCGGVSESVTDGQTGFIVPINDPEKLAEKTICLAEDRRKREAMGKAGLEKFLSSFSAKIFAEKFEHLYADVLNTRSEEMPDGEKVLLAAFLETYKSLSDLHWQSIERDKPGLLKRTSELVRSGINLVIK